MGFRNDCDGSFGGVCWNTRREILWFLHTISITIQFISAFDWGELKKVEKNKNILCNSASALMNLTFVNVAWYSRAVCCCRKHTAKENRIRAERNQNILNAHIKFFRFITVDLWNLFRHWPKSCVNLRLEKREADRQCATISSHKWLFFFYLSNKMSPLIINWRLTQFTDRLMGLYGGINSLHHILKTSELNWIKPSTLEIWKENSFH